jgi:hypothetical protein
MKYASTRSVAIAAPPAAVLDVVGDGARLPEWAPGFAPAVRADGDLWVIDTGGSELRIHLRTDRESGTVDILRAADERVGAFSRVVPNGEGSEFLFTLLFDEGTDPAAIDAQMEIVEGELATVRALVES